ncbi:TRAP transporter small permease subunit [Thioalbus denitrificans]|uniref:TRAP transporter small permease protein n=1 Tax=Thioalbus denitrificans TaxID=547122 RepID=A0A369CDP9_9GAMM|nr:TRAP transporter small permease subunit [Thioalbus denitrificans]RCX31235.1 TRAP-type mannitol/chloroaromatic compound transport system permease small subunit [Thioalbus denitrificans]
MTDSPLARHARRLDAFVERVGRGAAWLTLALVLLVAGNVLARYLLHTSSVALQELEWHLLAALSLLAASYTLQQNEHVRVDILYQRYPEIVRRWIDGLVPLVIIIPFALFIAWLSLKFTHQAYAIGEVSPDPGGLGYRYLIKAFIPLGFTLIAVQALSMLLATMARIGLDDRSVTWSRKR